MEKIKVLIVDDSAFMRKLISDFLSEDSLLEVIGTARNGEDALKKIKELKPDVVTLDVEMPVLDGISALKRIMQEHPVPVIMLSSTTKIGAENTLLAIQIGAIDFIAKPSGPISLDLHKVKKELIDKIISASKVKLSKILKIDSEGKSTITLPNSYSKMELSENVLSSTKDSVKPKWNKHEKKIILIGTSTGGPRALQQVITKLPGNIDAPILIVQHMPPGFTRSLANRLNNLSAVKVKEAEQGEMIQKGVAYIAPGGYHLKIKSVEGNITIELDQSVAVNGHRPSVDVLFDSASHLTDYAKVAVVMTGMGSDGANGLVTLANRGNTKAIAESKETSIVYGMPKAAIATNKIDEIKHLEYIAETILKFV